MKLRKRLSKAQTEFVVSLSLERGNQERTHPELEDRELLGGLLRAALRRRLEGTAEDGRRLCVGLHGGRRLVPEDDGAPSAGGPAVGAVVAPGGESFQVRNHNER